MEGSKKAARAQGLPSDRATTERVAQAAQLFANLTQPGEPRRNGARPQPTADPKGAALLPEAQELLELLHAAVTASDRLAVEIEALRADMDVTIDNVKLLHRGVKVAIRSTNARVAALEEATGGDPEPRRSPAPPSPSRKRPPRAR